MGSQDSIKKHPIMFRALKLMKLTEAERDYIRSLAEFEKSIFIKGHDTELILGGPVPDWIKAHERFERKRRSQ